ncbi:hypothetical protein H6P81_007867 [Aristolochia fimbriata]|uniref:Major facilitator superfamily (MFS) profile domain-containing protein n=1 Tax=Aristolochia fimbriata TaxID=158543 RepID=A0AAV7F1R1_ARIFI|nr:hypothetical protein H6P81_007867 [Aristolochia fimbriata]
MIAVFMAVLPTATLDVKLLARAGLHHYGPYSLLMLFIYCLDNRCAPSPETALPISSLFPFVYFMVRDFHIAKSDQDIGFYAGYVGSSFMFGRALTSVFCGMVADKYGRKPVIMIGTVSVVVLNTLFGLSTNFWMAVATRFLLGSANGLLGPMKAYAVEVCRKEHQAIGMSIVSTSWGIGLIIGPALGGFLAQPAEKYPKIFSQNSLFGKFPYFLPCFCISLFAVFATISCLWLPETLHKHNELQKDAHDSSEDIEASSSSAGLKEYIQESEEKEASSNESLLKNWPLMSSIIVYCIFSLHNMAYSEIFSLWAVSNREYGGLSFSTQDVGQVLAVSGFGLLNVLSVSITTGLLLLQNNAVEQHQRGAANGISMTAMSLAKAAGPAGGGTLFAWAQKRQEAFFLPEDHMVFFVLNLVEFLGIVFTFKALQALPKK